MKRAITVIVFSVVLFALGMTECVLVSKVVSNVDDQVARLVTEYEANKDNVVPLIAQIDSIKQYWDQKESMLCLVFNHKDMSIITDGLSRVRSYTENNDYENGIVELKVLKENTEKQPHVMGFNIHNIL